MTWHQWHQTASRSSSTKRFSRLASAKAWSDQGCQFKCGLGAADFCASAGVATIRSRSETGRSRVIAAPGDSTPNARNWIRRRLGKRRANNGENKLWSGYAIEDHKDQKCDGDKETWLVFPACGTNGPPKAEQQGRNGDEASGIHLKIVPPSRERVKLRWSPG